MEPTHRILPIFALFIGVVGGLVIFLWIVLQLEDFQQFQSSTQFALVLLGLSTVYGILLIGLAETTKKIARVLLANEPLQHTE